MALGFLSGAVEFMEFFK